MMAEYADLHRRANRGEVPGAKWVRCQHGNGWGNRFQQVVSCYLFAMVSGRIFYLSAQESLIAEWDYFFRRPSLAILQPNQTLVDAAWKRSNFAWGVEPHRVACEDLRGLFAEVDVLDVSAVRAFDYWGSSVLSNPHHKLYDRMPLNWFEIMWRSVFALNATNQAAVDAFREQHFGKYTVGVQVRTWSPNVAGAEAVRNPQVPIDLFLQAALLVAREAPVPLRDVALFIATPSAEFVSRAKAAWPGGRVSRVEGEVSFGTRPGLVTALLDFALLGLCDDLVVTEVSSFGTVAGAATGHTPVTCNHERLCYRRLTAEPCQVVPYPVRRSPCGNDTLHTYLPGVQSTCGYFSSSYIRKQWFDYYDSWSWNGRNKTWRPGDADGVVY